MAALSHSESRRLYSWWWDSHNSPKNSKWLQENLTDMDGKVKSMIKLIEEDADSFARRAEMYYKKRPELMKLVEEFYRAYRALAERYNHATGELRHAHRTIAKAFPDQLPPELIEDLPSKSLALDHEPHTPEIKGHVRALFELDDSLDDSQGLSPFDIKTLRGFKGQKQEKERKESSHGEVHRLSKENENLKNNIFHESERAGKAENEVLGLRKALANLQAEKEEVLLHYQQCLENLAKLEGDLRNAQMDSMGLIEKASRAEIETQTLKETLFQLEAEKNAGLVKLNEYLEKISNLEAMVSQLQERARALDKRTIQAESEPQALKAKISRLELEKEEVICQYKLNLGKVSELENIISVMEDEVALLKKKAEKAETEVTELRMALADLNKKKEASALQYKFCLEKISSLEKDLSRAKQDVDRLKLEVSIGNSKLQTAEEKCGILEMTNQSLRVEANNLSKMIAMKDREVSEKQEELENLQTCLKSEHLHQAQIEATLQTLQNLHSQSQDDQRALVIELQELLKMLKELELSKNGLEEEIRKEKDENQNLSRTNLSSAAFMENMQNEIISLREIKERLEKEVLHHMGLSDSLQQEVSSLKEEIKGLNLNYHTLLEQVEDNSNLRQICEEGSNEKTMLLKKIGDLEEAMRQKVIVESTLSSVMSELESSREKLKALQESCQFFHGEMATFVSEKASLLSQLHTVTENMHKLLERNAILENSLSNAKVELEGLREKSKGLEEICELLKNERLHLVDERGNLALKLENVEKRLESLEKRYVRLEEKYAEVEREKKALYCQVKELEISLSVEKQERSIELFESETRLTGLENEIHLLREENIWKQKESVEDIEQALKAQFEISILQKFIKDMEEKNYSLIIDCQKHVEASKLTEKLISELESESIEQHVEAELLLDEIERLRLAIYQVFCAIENEAGCVTGSNKFENEETLVDHVLGIIEGMKRSISKHEDDKQLLLVQNSVLLTLLEQFESKGVEIESQKIYMEKEFKIVAENLAEVKNERDELVEMNRRLRSDVKDGHQLAATFEAELRDLCSKQSDMRKCYNVLQEMYFQVNQDNTSLLKKLSDMEEKFFVDQDNDAILLELLAIANESTVLKSFGDEKVKEVKSLRDDLNRQHELNCVLEKETRVLIKQMELQKTEYLKLKDSLHKFETEFLEMRESNVEKGVELLNTTRKLEAAESSNSELYGTVDELKMEIQEYLQIRENLEKNILQLSESDSNQKKEIDGLCVVNTNLKSELGLLREEIKEKITTEQISSSELQEKKHEFELWEAEASAFYFDLQISSVHEVLFQNKVQELTGVCKALDSECASKTSEIEQMKVDKFSMESEISELKSQISAYAPVIASIQDDITFLEHNVVLQTSQLKAAHNQESEILKVSAHPSYPEILLEDQTLLSLLNLQMRVKAFGKLMQETNKSVPQRRSCSTSKQEPPMGEIEQSKPRRSCGKDNRKKGYSSNEPTPSLQKIKTKACEIRNGMLMKDIPLDQVSDRIRKRGNVGRDDQMLELWETAEDGVTIGESLRRSYKMTDKDIVYDQFENVKHNSEPPSTDSDMEKELGVDKLEVLISSQLNQGASDRKILERLASDAQKLENLQITLQNLVSKLETNKMMNKKAKDVDFETVNEQLLEAEETVSNLADLNGQLVKDMQQCPSPNSRASVQLKEAVKMKRRKVMEQARKGSERIGRLQLELQKIQYILLKMEDDKKNKARNKFFRNKTIILRDFIYNGRINSGKRKKGPICGCFRSSSSRNGSIGP